MRTGILFAMALVAVAPLVAQEEPPAPPAPPAPPKAPAAPRTRTIERRVVVTQGGGSYLGIGVADIDAERAKALKLSDEHGVEVRNVGDDSPAAKAGLKEGDVILEYNGQRVEGKDQLIRMVKETPAGRQTRLQVWRNGAAQSVNVTIGARPADGMLMGNDGRLMIHDGKLMGDDGKEWSFTMPELPPIPPLPDMPRPAMSWRSTMLGVESESLNSQLAQYFGVKEGVLVRSVVKASAAEKAGIKAGDVIVKVDGTTVTTPREITSALRSMRGTKRTIPVVIVRERKETTVNVTLEEGQGSGRLGRPARALLSFDDSDC